MVVQLFKVYETHLDGMVQSMEATNALAKQKNYKVNEYKDEKESMNSHNIITYSMVSKVVPTLVSYKSTKKNEIS